MNMVNEKLIKKYINGNCTPEEKERVEAWLQSTTVPYEADYAKEFATSKDRIWNESEKMMVEAWLESDEYNESLDLPDHIKATQKEQAWQNITGSAHQENPKTIPLYKTLIRYAAAACLAGGLFAGGYFTASNNSLQEDTVISQTSGQGKLQVTFEGGKTTQIPGNQFELLFDGNIQLSNLSDEPKTIICGNQTLLLRAGESYLLDRYQDRVSMANVSDIESMRPNLSQMLKGDFTITVLA